jgi:hypothetical protein
MAIAALLPSRESFLDGSTSEWNIDGHPVVGIVRLHRDEPWAAEVAAAAVADPETRERFCYDDVNQIGSNGDRLTKNKSDPNRICGPLSDNPTSDEIYIANRIDHINSRGLKWLLDLHNTVTRSRDEANEGFVIMPESLLGTSAEPGIMQMISRIGLRKVVAQPDWMMKGRLTGRKDFLLDSKLTVEWTKPRSEAEERVSTAAGLLIVRRLLDLEPASPTEIDIFHIDREIRRDEDLGSDANNFELFAPAGVWPVLYDNNVDHPIPGSYRSENTQFLGLAANHVTSGVAYPDGKFVPINVTFGNSNNLC